MKRKFNSITTLFALVLICSTLHAQHSTGTIEYSLEERASTPAKLSARLVNIDTRVVVQRVNVSDKGHVSFRDVPFGRYRLQIVSDDAVYVQRIVYVESSVPIVLKYAATDEYSLPEVVVDARRTPIDRTETQTTTHYSAQTIAELPSASDAKGIEAVLLSTPGVVPDEDGRMHVRGESSQLQYVIDGIPVTQNLSRIYSTLFAANRIKSLDVQTGNLNAEYGVSAAGIMAITTKSGYDAPAFANASALYGSWNTLEASVELGGNILNNSLAGFFSATISNSDRYLDPIQEGAPINDKGETQSYFAKLNAILTPTIDLSFLGSFDKTIYSVPNSKVAVPAQDQKQDLTGTMLGLRATMFVSDNSTLSLLGYLRSTKSTFTSNGLTRITTTADSAQAVASNEKMFIGAERENSSQGGQLEFTTRAEWMGAHNVAEFGVGVETYPLDEFFTFAITNSKLSDSSQSGGDIRYRPYDITQGGKPFVVDQSKTGKRFSAFLQDKIEWDNLTINAGVRFDMFDLLDQESSISPRLSAAYSFSDQLVVRAGYSRVVMQAPTENILVSSSNEARQLVGVDQGTTPTNVMAQSSNNIEFGAHYLLSDQVALDFAGYGKLIDNFLVNVELGNSGIIFPVNLKSGVVAGGEIRAELHDWNNITANASFSVGVSLGQKPEDGSSPIAAGLILGEEGRNYSHPFAGEDVFQTEHNQLMTGVLGATYHNPSGWYVRLGGRFDSGLPFDLTDAAGHGMTAEQSRIELRARGYSDAVIDLLALEPEEENPDSPDKSVAPHVTLDASAGIDLKQFIGIHSKISVTAMNLLDTPYLYKFESSFGGTHFGLPRTLTVQLEIGL